MYYKKGTRILLAFMLIFMLMGSAWNSSMINNLNSTEGNTNPDKSSNHQNISNENALINALGDENTDKATKISDTYEFLESKLCSFLQKGQDIIVSTSQFEADDSIVKIVTIQTENETHIETMTFTAKFDKDQCSGPLYEDVDLLLTPDDVEHHSAMTFPPILMGWQWGWWYHYEWEYEIKVKVLWWWVSIFRAYFEISFGAIFRFQMPVLLTADVPDIIVPGETKEIDLTLTAIDLEDYYEFVIGAGLVLKAGAYVLGVIGFGYKLDLGWFKYQNIETPLEEPWYPTDPLRIGLIGEIAKIAPPFLKPILGFIADNLVDASIFIYPGIGSNLVTAKATVYGTGVTINGQKSLQIEWTDSPSTSTISLATTAFTTDIVLALSTFTIHLNEFWLKFEFALDYQWIPELIPGFPDYDSWEIGEWVFATPFDLFSLQSPQAVYIPFSVTPKEYGVDLLDITPSSQDIEAGGTTSYTLNIQNTGNTIDVVELSVGSGIDPDWVIFLPKYITLGPDETKTVEMLVYPPRHYTTTAGDYTFVIEATSLGSLETEEPKFDDIPGVINILPFYDVAVRRTSHFETGIIEILSQDTDIAYFEVQNLGNVVDTFELSVSSDFGADCFVFPAQITLQPGETATVPVEITPPFVHLGYYEVSLIGTSTSTGAPLIKDNGIIFVRVLPTCDSVKYILNNLQDELLEIPDVDWRNPSSQLKNAMNNKIYALINIMSGGCPAHYEDAYNKLLRDIKPKLTGLKTDEEETPWDGGIYKKPWIIDEDQQEILRMACNLLLTDIRFLIDLST